MIEDIKQMRRRHETEISLLQKTCRHKKHHRSAYMWAPGHLGADIEVCDYCGKSLKRYNDGKTVWDKYAKD